MKVDKKFVEFYNTTFDFILKIGGIECLIEYFHKIGPTILHDLDKKVGESGLIGAWTYWSKVLTQEGAAFDLNCNESKLTLKMKKCPSMSSLETPCREYCTHCKVMYADLFRKHGYKFSLEKKGNCSCEIRVTKG